MRTRPAADSAVRVERGERRRAAGAARGLARSALHGAPPRGQVLEIQRSRLLIGAASAIEEHGYTATTVAQITTRARVSRRTFYELFEDREACLAALVEDVLALLEDELARAELDGLAWRERVRGGLTTILAFFDREPVLARVCVLQALSSGPRVLDRREAILARLAAALDEGRGESRRARDCTPLTAEGLVGAAFGIVHARLLRGEREPLLGLVGELMGIIVLPYLGPAAARREQARPAPAPAPRAADGPPAPTALSQDPLQGLRLRLTYRTTRVLECISARPGASNRAVSGHAGIHDQGQISKLLARLERLGLVVNAGDGATRGEPNAWSLTALGERVVQQLQITVGGENGAG